MAATVCYFATTTRLKANQVLPGSVWIRIRNIPNFLAGSESESEQKVRIQIRIRIRI
jgi:hypothetical protein